MKTLFKIASAVVLTATFVSSTFAATELSPLKNWVKNVECIECTFDGTKEITETGNLITDLMVLIVTQTETELTLSEILELIDSPQ